MKAVSMTTVPVWMGKALAVLSVGFFWILPSSPFIAIAALMMTVQVPGWPRKLAIAGAVLSAAFTIVAAAAICLDAIQAGLI